MKSKVNEVGGYAWFEDLPHNPGDTLHHLILVKENQSDLEKFRTLVHEGGHYMGNKNDYRAEQVAKNDCVKRNLKEEEKLKRKHPMNPINPPFGPCEDPLAECEDPDDGDPDDRWITGYCEYEGRVRHYQDDEGNDWFWIEWVLLWCVET